jgi:hypothetical protein
MRSAVDIMGIIDGILCAKAGGIVGKDKCAPPG